jgi:hypothetical protein
MQNIFQTGIDSTHHRQIENFLNKEFLKLMKKNRQRKKEERNTGREGRQEGEQRNPVGYSINSQ